MARLCRGSRRFAGSSKIVIERQQQSPVANAIGLSFGVEGAESASRVDRDGIEDVARARISGSPPARRTRICPAPIRCRRRVSASR